MDKKELLLHTLNLIIHSCKPVKYNTFNVVLTEKDKDLLKTVERYNPKIGIKVKDKKSTGSTYACTTLSIIATITDILIDERLAFNINKD